MIAGNSNDGKSHCCFFMQNSVFQLCQTNEGGKMFLTYGKDDFITEILKMTEKYKIPWEKAER